MSSVRVNLPDEFPTFLSFTHYFMNVHSVWQGCVIMSDVQQTIKAFTIMEYPSLSKEVLGHYIVWVDLKLINIQGGAIVRPSLIALIVL